MEGEENTCYECGSEEILDTIYDGKMVKFCRRCANMNGAIILKKPTIEQLTKVERNASLQERVRAWRKQRQSAPEATLETLRLRKQELQREEAKKREELLRKQAEERNSVIDFSSRRTTIGDLREMSEQRQEQLQIQKEEKKEEQNPELEMNDFIQEVKRLKEEEVLEQEIVVPIPTQATEEPEMEENQETQETNKEQPIEKI